MDAARGGRLYALVEEYAALGDHHTGTPVDSATRAWFASELEQRGARVETTRYEFERYVAQARVIAAGREIRCAPLFYSGIGDVDTVEPFVAGFAAGGGAGTMASAAADDLLTAARELGSDAALLATDEPDGRLVALNRPVTEPHGPIAVLVAGAERAALNGDVRVTASAHVAQSQSATVVARLGARVDREPPLVLTTPLTGWFACAGERGTGIAVALELAAELAGDLPVVVVGTTGHELGFLGLRDHLAHDAATPRLVIHVGASLGAGDGGELSRLRAGLVDGVAPHLLGALGEVLAPAQLPLIASDPNTPDDAGEGALWRGRGAPVLSLLGWFDRFHTPDDVPDAVTSPELLELVAGAVIGAARLLLTP